MSAFTAVHRALGERPGPLTDAMIQALVDQAVPEGSDLEFKRDFPSGSLADSDLPKDLAALANAGGGVIVYGISDAGHKAGPRTDVVLTEILESSLRKAAATKVAPGLINLGITSLGEAPQRCVLVEVPASPEAPHMYFPREGGLRAPLRVGADTHFMTERQIEAAYRARFTRVQDRAAQLAELYLRAHHGCDTGQRAWFIAAAVPRTEATRRRLPRDEAQQCFRAAVQAGLDLAALNAGAHPLYHGVNVDVLRPGLRSWVAPRRSTGGPPPPPMPLPRSVTPAPSPWLLRSVRIRADDPDPGGHEVVMETVECALADFLGLLRATAAHLPVIDYDLEFGIAWSGEQDLQLLRTRRLGHGLGEPFRETVPLFIPVRATLATHVDDATYQREAYELARDCANQAAGPVPGAFMPPPEAASGVPQIR